MKQQKDVIVERERQAWVAGAVAAVCAKCGGSGVLYGTGCQDCAGTGKGTHDDLARIKPAAIQIANECAAEADDDLWRLDIRANEPELHALLEAIGR